MEHPKRFEGELEIRIMCCKKFIEFLETECKDDPRQPDALNEYKMQLAKLESELATPPDVVVGLKPANLSGIVPKL